MSRHIYKLKKPAAWHGEAWREALPIGNGLTGALIHGYIANERIIFNRHDLWEGGYDRPIPDVSDTFLEIRRLIDAGDFEAANKNLFQRALYERGYFTELGYNTTVGTPHPLGTLHINFSADKLFRDYERGIDMRKSEAFVRFSIGSKRFERRAFTSRADDVTVIRMTADTAFESEYGFELYGECLHSITDKCGLYREADYGSVKVRFFGDFTSEVTDGKVKVTGKDYLVAVKCASSGTPCSLDGIEGLSYEELLARHTALYTPLYDAANIELVTDEELSKTNEQLLSDAYVGEASAALIERLWRFGRYLFISAAAEDANPVALYGLWHGEGHLEWSQYVSNENVQMTYWHVPTGGLSYSIRPLIKYYTDKTEKLRECAKKMFGMRGIWLSAYTTPISSGPNVPVDIITGWISSAGWMARHFYEYYIYTGDEELLRERILPFMRETALFYLDYAVESGEYIRLYPSVSPENIPEGFCGLLAENATMDFAVMKELLTNLLEGIDATGLYTDERDEFLSLLKRIPPYEINSDGAVKEWMHPEMKDNYHHRHLSHVYPVFPGCEVTKESDPKLFEAFRRAVELRKLGSQSGWSLAHTANVYARMGNAEKSVECLDIMAKSVIMDSLMTTHNDWRTMGMTMTWGGEAYVQLDAAFGITAALQEMIFSSVKDSISLLPAVPERLKCGAAYGLRFPEGVVDISWSEDKANVKITAERRLEKSVLLLGDVVCRISLDVGEEKTFTFNIPKRG